MTNEEAREVLLNLMTNETLVTEVYEAFYTAVVALEKQIPKKASEKELQTETWYHVWYQCPICSEDLSSNQYCDNCGQAIDWS